MDLARSGEIATRVGREEALVAVVQKAHVRGEIQVRQVRLPAPPGHYRGLAKLCTEGDHSPSV